MLAIQDSYKALKTTGSDIEFCRGQNIQDFFYQMGLKTAWEFDTRIEKFSKDEVEHMSGQPEG